MHLLIIKYKDFLSITSIREEKGDPMDTPQIKIRLMEDEDFDSVLRIDEKVLKTSRREYYEQRFEMLFNSGEYLLTSLVAEDENGNVVGFIMGALYVGEFGITSEGASLDTVGVDPYCQKQGIGERLMSEFIDHLRELEVKKINTLVDKNDDMMMRYFKTNRFEPSKNIINLERKI